MEINKKRLRDILEKIFIFSLGIIFFGGVFAAWNSAKTSADILTAQDWNDLVSHINDGIPIDIPVCVGNNKALQYNGDNFLCVNLNTGEEDPSDECTYGDKKCELNNGQYYAYNCNSSGVWYNEILCPNGCNSNNRECASTPTYINIGSTVSSGFNNIVEICGIREGVVTHAKGTCLQGAWQVDPCNWTSTCSTGWENVITLGTCSPSCVP